MKTDASIRLYQPGDESELNDLFNLVFGENRSLEQWQWKFKRLIPWPGKSIVVAQAQGRIIGAYPAIFVWYKVGNKLLPIPLVVDTAIHPEWKGFRLILSLKRYISDNFRNIGVAFAFGFPTSQHYEIGKKLMQYKDLLSKQIFFKRLNWRLAFRLRFPGLGLENLVYILSNRICKLIHLMTKPSVRQFEVSRIISFDQQFDQLWNEVSSNYEIIARRNSQYLNWRYPQSSAQEYTIYAAYGEHNRLRGYMVLKVEDNEAEKVGIIVDFLTTSEAEVMNALLYKTVAYFLAQRVDYVKCLAGAHYPQYPALLGYGFFPRYQSVKLVYELYTNSLTPQYLEDPQNWFVTYGDTDWH